jgi:hypothetical protein
VSRGIVTICLQGVTQERHSLLNFPGVYQEVGEEHLRIKQARSYRQSPLVRGLGTAGNPGAMTGDYTVRLKMPDGYRIAPQWHPNRENVTVIAGTFKVGMGDRFDESKMGDFPAGSFALSRPRYASLRDGERRGRGPNPRRISVPDQLRQL